MIVKKVDITLWKEKIETRDISPFLTSRFLGSIQKKGLSPEYFIFLENDEIIGGISGIVDRTSNTIIDKLGLMKILTFYTGPYMDDKNRAPEALDVIFDHLEKKGYIKFRLNTCDEAPFPKTKKEGFRYPPDKQYIIPLDGPDYRKNFRRRIRRKIKTARKAELETHYSNDPALVEKLFELMKKVEEHRRSRGYTDYDYSQFPHVDKSAIMRMVENGIGSICYIKDGDEILSMMVFLKNGTHSTGFIIGTDIRGYSNGANTVNHTDLMEHLKDEGCAYFNLMGLGLEGSERDGLAQFKEGLGASLHISGNTISPIIAKGLRKAFFDLNKKLRNQKNGKQ
jgi:hypothetical protein